jgi:hypothetical protein
VKLWRLVVVIVLCAVACEEAATESTPGDDGGTDASDANAAQSISTDEGTEIVDGVSSMEGSFGTEAGTGDDSGSPEETSLLLDDVAFLEDTSTPANSSAPDDSPDDMGPYPMGCTGGATVIAMTMLSSLVKFNTTGAVCVTYMGSVNGWSAAETEGRSVTIVGSTTQTVLPITDDTYGPLSPGADGYIYWNFTAGTSSSAEMTAY